jgi:hypothetical protein|tara:strand:- start:85 stop:411 length:327 start_codon:yes stop_codon:yes gene_type:complete
MADKCTNKLTIFGKKQGLIDFKDFFPSTAIGLRMIRKEEQIKRVSDFKLVYEFETKWDPPIPILKEESKIFPMLLFKLRYERWMSFEEGYFILMNREVILDITRGYDS